jgi:hypothetical protein
VRTRQKLDNGLVSVGGLHELSEFSEIVIVDTNTKYIEGDKVSAACFVHVHLEYDGDKYSVVTKDNAVHVFEFRNVIGNPELLAIVKITNEIVRGAPVNAPFRMAIVTDTELSRHDRFNSGNLPLHGPHCLPSNFTLFYSSSDVGQEVLNRLMKFCDKMSSDYLRYLENGEIMNSALKRLPEDSSVQHRYLKRDDLKIKNPIVSGFKLVEGQQISLYKRKIDR